MAAATTIRACLHPFIVTSKSAISREILRKFEFIAVEGHSIGHQSWCQSKAHYATFYLSLTVTLAVSPTVFEKLTFKTRKWLVFPYPSLVRRPRSGRTHRNFWMKLAPQKLEDGATVLIHPCDGQTGGRAGDSMYTER